MPNREPNKESNIAIHWVDNLVGTPGRFGFNIMLTLTGGTLFSFSVWPSMYMLVVFGVVSPLLFTFCLYSLMPMLGNLEDSPLPQIFRTRSSNMVVMLFDMLIIVVLALLIHIDVIDYLFFRLLQTVIFPALMLVMLRMLYIGIRQNKE
ncbi:EscU/YscU/HrcU family type III secretion system export apparatus switch protein [Perlabentimonas gracilis]|uniref:EscU/YscU/HrcU family type III secretion system export apparatus switch protein n=1 Tax=Perlabentimonas gracilis TaxID=2715279 RepID=UPI00140D8C6D|nr:EscU/YscU/HrcU family type III secretion system export apparatus switch protein [Perlabentimonas gracilis]NHB68954.1 EscU/YscU/HrcU family type III secretion system export apparatus switch protein [Perlabentimonas gracilis]